MRRAYRRELADFAHDLTIMCDVVRASMSLASEGLVHGSWAAAEQALEYHGQLDEIRHRCEQRAIDLLALEAPAASDLRQVVSSIYIVNDFDRMGALAAHVAGIVCKRHPEPVLPEDMTGLFKEVGLLVQTMADKVRSLLADPDPNVALELVAQDEDVDEFHRRLLTMLTLKKWPHTTRQAVDLAMLARYYERYGDHCVNVAARLVYLVTGHDPDGYLAEQQRRDDDLIERAQQKARERRSRPGASGTASQ